MQAQELEAMFVEAVRKHTAHDVAGARELLLRILAERPGHPDVLLRLGSICYESGEYAEAATHLAAAATQKPGNPSCELLLALSLKSLKRFDVAERILTRYAALPDADRNASFAAFHLASLYFEKMDFDKATEVCLKSLARFRGDGAFLFLYGQSSIAAKRYDDAIAAFDALMNREDSRVRALLAVARAFRAKRDFTGFVKRAAPEIARTGDAELMIVASGFYKDIGDQAESMRLQLAALEKKPEDYHVHSYQIKSMTESDAVDEQAIYDYSRLWDERFGTPKDVPAFTSWLNGPLDGRKIRVGVLSRTFRRHVTQTILRPLLPELAKRFELYGYYDDAECDSFTDEVRKSFVSWHNTSSLTEAQAAKVIHDDALDVLIDISGHFNGARTTILTYRPAPVQIHYADSSSSLGMKAVQYRFSDAIAEPPERGDPYSVEKVLRLPHGFFLYQPLFDLPEAGPCPYDQNGYITFGSCTALYKLTPTTLRLWKSALDAVPGSVFVLSRDEFSGDSALRERWMRIFEEAGFPRGRFSIRTGTKEDFVRLRFYDGIDIALDAFPYSGVTTALDGMWMGVPIVNYRETRLINRVCSSLLTRVDLQDLVADRYEDFAKIAANLASDHERRRKLRRNLRETMRLSSLCDPAGMAADMEAAIRGVLGVA